MAEAFPNAVVVDLVSSVEESSVHDLVHLHVAQGACIYSMIRSRWALITILLCS